MSDLTYQQQVVYQQQENALKVTWEANDQLDSKANVLITGGSIVTGLVAGASFFSSPVSNVWVAVLSGLIFLAFFLMLVFASQVWFPRDVRYPGPEDIKTMYKLYISRDLDNAYDQALTDLVHAVDQAKGVNRDKYIRLTWAIRAFQVQLILLAIVTMFRSHLF